MIADPDMEFNRLRAHATYSGKTTTGVQDINNSIAGQTRVWINMRRHSADSRRLSMDMFRCTRLTNGEQAQR